MVASPKSLKEQSGIYRASIDQRKVESDPSDIDDESVIERNQREFSEKNVADIEFSQTVSSRSGIDDISEMYDDISEFERRFYRKDNPQGAQKHGQEREFIKKYHH